MNEKNTQEPLTFLIADDDSTFRFLARKALENAGFSVEDVEDGFQAANIFIEKKPDIVLLDIKMPRIDGIEACSKIRQLPGGDGIPILIVTGLNDMESIDRAYKAGATDFITKPVNWLALGFRVRFMLRANREMIEMMKSDRETQSQLSPLSDSLIQCSSRRTIDSTIMNNIRALEKEMGADFLKHLIQHFLSQAPDLIQSLCKSTNKRDKSIALTDIAKLKSQSISLGAINLAAMCSELEATLQADIRTNISKILSDIESEFTQVEQALIQEI